ncbi:MAG: NAD(P)-binding domain-containing protein [Patescibacteria group bacterium]|nr:NAD(P)-binding domain-containing protein [Patescibacteria group bacterium]
MKIVFFEVASWEKDLLIKNFPEAYLVEDKLSLENVAKYQNAEIISSFVYSQLTKDILEKMPNLKFIATRSTGFDHIDISYCCQKNIKVSNVPEYGSRTVAEHTFALILTLTKKIYQSINQAKNFDFNHENIRGIDLFGKTIGIVGLGKIGFEVLKIAQGFGMRILVFNRSQKQELKEKYNFDYVDLKTIVSQSDIVSLHLPYNKETHHLINKNNIFDFKKGSYLINTARGPVVETEAIILGLEKGIFDGVGLDVLEEEKELAEETEILTKIYKKDVDLKTIVLNHVLVNHPKVIITPHNAFNTKEALERITKTTIENIKAFLNDSLINLV